EEEVLQVAVAVLAPRRQLHEVGAIGDAVEHASLRIERVAQLIEVYDLLPGSVPHRALCRGELPQEEPEERRLSRSVRANEPDTIPAHDRGGKVADDDAIAVRERQVTRLDDQSP